MVVSKLRDRVSGSELSSRTRDPIRRSSKLSDIESFREGKREKQRLEGAYSSYVSAYAEYEDAFSEYAKERDEYADAISEWKSEEERAKEKEEFELAYSNLLSSTVKVEGTEVGKSNKTLSSFKKKLIVERKDLVDVEEENKGRIEKLDVETTELLEPFRYYEGLGFAKGDIGVSDFKIVSGGGIGSTFYGAGEYSVYDPSSGLITQLKAQPQSKFKEIVVNVDGKGVAAEDIDDLGLVQKQEVVGEGFDFSKYKDNDKYTIVRDAGGMITEIRAKKETYTAFKEKGYKRLGSFTPEVIKVSGGKVKSWTKYNDYKAWWDDDEKGRNVGKTEEIIYDQYGLKVSRNTWEAERTDQRTDGQILVNDLTETFKDGVQTSRVGRHYWNRQTTIDKKDYTTGVHTKTDYRGKTQTFSVGKAELPTGEALQNIRKYGALTGLSFSSRWRTAEEGEEQRTLTSSFTVGGEVHAVTKPVFNAPVRLGQTEAFFGSSGQAQRVLSGLPFSQKPSSVPLKQYKAEVFERIGQERADAFRATPKVIVKNEFTGRQSVVTVPRKLTDPRRQRSVLGSGVVWGSPDFRRSEKSFSQRLRDTQRRGQSFSQPKVVQTIKPIKIGSRSPKLI